MSRDKETTEYTDQQITHIAKLHGKFSTLNTIVHEMRDDIKANAQSASDIKTTLATILEGMQWRDSRCEQHSDELQKKERQIEKLQAMICPGPQRYGKVLVAGLFCLIAAFIGACVVPILKYMEVMS